MLSPVLNEIEGGSDRLRILSTAMELETTTQKPAAPDNLVSRHEKAAHSSSTLFYVI